MIIIIICRSINYFILRLSTSIYWTLTMMSLIIEEWLLLVSQIMRNWQSLFWVAHSQLQRSTWTQCHQLPPPQARGRLEGPNLLKLSSMLSKRCFLSCYYNINCRTVRVFFSISQIWADTPLSALLMFFNICFRFSDLAWPRTLDIKKSLILLAWYINSISFT